MKNDAIEKREKPADILSLVKGLNGWKIRVEVEGKTFEGEYTVEADGVRTKLSGTSWLDGVVGSARVEKPPVVARELLSRLAQTELELAETRYVLARVDPKSDCDDLISRIKRIEGVTRVFFRASDIVTVCFGEDPRAAAFLMHRLGKIEGVQSVEMAPEHRQEGD